MARKKMAGAEETILDEGVIAEAPVAVEEPAPAQESEPVPQPVEVDTRQVELPKRMATTSWRSWGAPASLMESKARVTLPAGVAFEVLKLAKDWAVVRHPTSGAEVTVRRGMIKLV